MPHDSQNTPVQISVPTLCSRYFQHRAVAAAAGLLFPEAGEVVPYESAPVQPVDPRLAWDEAEAALRFYDPTCNTSTWKTPVEWAALVAGHEPVTALPFCLGNFPQLVRDINALMQARELPSQWTGSSRGFAVDSVEPYAQDALQQKHYGRFLLAAGVLRLAGQLERAQQLLDRHQHDMSAAWQASWANERASLAWHFGHTDEARKRWQAQESSVPVHFNRGVAALFSGRIAEAKTALAQAVEQLPEDNAWHHLGRMYVVLASLS